MVGVKREVLSPGPSSRVSSTRGCALKGDVGVVKGGVGVAEVLLTVGRRAASCLQRCTHFSGLGCCSLMAEDAFMPGHCHSDWRWCGCIAPPLAGERRACAVRGLPESCGPAEQRAKLLHPRAFTEPPEAFCPGTELTLRLCSEGKGRPCSAAQPTSQPREGGRCLTAAGDLL